MTLLSVGQRLPNVRSVHTAESADAMGVGRAEAPSAAGGGREGGSFYSGHACELNLRIKGP